MNVKNDTKVFGKALRYDAFNAVGSGNHHFYYPQIKYMHRYNT